MSGLEILGSTGSHMRCGLPGLNGRLPGLDHLAGLHGLLHGRLYGLADMQMRRHRIVRVDIDQGLFTDRFGDKPPGAARSDVHHGERDAGKTDDHQDPADRLDIDAIDTEVRGECQNRADGDKSEACSESHFKPSVRAGVRRLVEGGRTRWLESMRETGHLPIGSPIPSP